MSSTRKKCALCHKELDLVEAGANDEENDGDRDRAAPETPQDWCIVIHRENDDLVLTLREFRRDGP